ncbi:protein phosphatase 2A regulatory B subunit [Tribonema minus]|uniref:Serine/threonine protein phosphatase 2A regulatory subunit n=1 Tax=Tribonema minus TaxID=303371 RepID=A0A835ZAF4_9STRA|nr:protein phosphatase 2A regulatory B subunit [Tribonema minus]
MANAVRELPLLKDVNPQKREALFQQKLQLCSVVFHFDDPASDQRGKDLKRQTLMELLDFVNTQAGEKMFTEAMYPDIMGMVTASVCRALPPHTADFDPDEDEPRLEPSWPHLQLVYEFFLRFVVSTEVNAKVAKKHIDQRFCYQLIELFDSEDPRERDYLKTILHRIYGKFMNHRSFIRKTIGNVFYRFVYETERHNGVGELLEILGSIINGFAIPLKKEHLSFLQRALIPLHKPKNVHVYHQQLSYCIVQYVEKDPDTVVPVLRGLIRFWPWSCSAKQVLFLNELEDILELLMDEQLQQVQGPLFALLAQCLGSQHFQVAERTLFLWNNDHLVSKGCFSRAHTTTILPVIYGPLYRHSLGHWNTTVEGLAQNVLKMYMEFDLHLFDRVLSEHIKAEEERKAKAADAEKRWTVLEEQAATARSKR